MENNIIGMNCFNGTHIYSFSVHSAYNLPEATSFRVEKVFYHLPKCRNQIGRTIEKMWNIANWPFREYFSMAYWIIASKR